MIDMDTDWTLVDFTPPKKAEPKPVDKGTCPKCGRSISRGIAMHIKYCRESKPDQT